MAIAAKQGEEVVFLLGWSDAAVKAVQACRDAAVPMLQALFAGKGCDPTRKLENATNCRRYGLVRYEEAVADFQRIWQANYKIFAGKMFEVIGTSGNSAVDSVLTTGLPNPDGLYGTNTGTALSLLHLGVPLCACQMAAWGQTAAGKEELRVLSSVRVVNHDVAPRQQQQQQQQLPQQQQQQQLPSQQQQTQVVFDQQQTAPVFAAPERNVSPLVYWGVGIAVLLAAGGTWYVLRRRKGRR